MVFCMNPVSDQLLKLCFIDGKPYNRLITEVFNRTGNVLVEPLAQLIDTLKRTEAGCTRICLTLDEDDNYSLFFYR